jgi:predicted permease
VESAAGVTTLPLGGGIDGFGLHVVGRTMANPEAAPSADRFVVTPGYFKTLDVRLVRGRLLDATDRQNALATAVINEKLARAEFGLEDAIGQQIRLGPPDAAPRTIVGIVGEVRHQGLDATPNYQVYVPQAQWVWAESAMTLVVRVAGDPLLLAMPIRAVLAELDPSQPVADVRAYADIVAATTATRRVSAWLLAGFAAVALTLAVIGLYGALGVLVGQRKHEIGVRMALGASAADIARRIVGQGMRPSMVGLLLGMATAGLLAGEIRSQLFGVSELDPMTFAVAGVVLVAAALLACAVPALRASRINPVTALRAE